MKPIRDKTEFGVVQAGEKGILNLGCTATVEKVGEAVSGWTDGHHQRRQAQV